MKNKTLQVSATVKRIAVIGIFFGVLTTAGCDPRDAANGAQPGGAPEVAVVIVQPQRVVLTTELPGRTSAYLVAEVRPQVNGIIQKRLFREGADVGAGDLLYQVDPAPFKAAYDNQRAALAKAEAELVTTRLRAARYGELLVDKAISQQDYDDVTAALQQAEAEVEYWKTAVQTARINLGYTRVVAPISGRIGKSDVTVGALVTAYQPGLLATIQQLDPIYVDVPQSSAELLRLNRSLGGGRLDTGEDNQRKVTLLLEDGSSYPLEGTLQFRDVTVESTTGSVILRIIFPNPDHVLLPGMFVRAVVKEGVLERAILIPQQAVSRDVKGNPVALVVDNADQVRQRMLALDRAVGDKWLVLSGLVPGDRLIVEGSQKVRPGARARAVPFDGGKAGAAAEDTNRSPAN